MNTLQSLLDTLPDYAKDIKLNVSSLLSNAEGHLTAQQVAGTVYAAALTAKYQPLIKAMTQYAESLLAEEYIRAVKAATTIMSMNNIYYRFVHLVADPEYSKLPARLRMNIIANPGVDKLDFELYSMAVSIINGCGKCMETHAQGLEAQGLSKEGVQQCARIAAVVNALAQVIAIEGVA